VEKIAGSFINIFNYVRRCDVINQMMYVVPNYEKDDIYHGIQILDENQELNHFKSESVVKNGVSWNEFYMNGVAARPLIIKAVDHYK